MRLYVISTAYAAKTRDLHFRSLAIQSLSPSLWEHAYRDAADLNSEGYDRSQVENISRTVGLLQPWDIVALVDGDDELASPFALDLVWQTYHEHPDLWLTYGSYVNASNHSRGIASPYITTDYREESWKASHLKTFRAGLFQRIKPEDLKAGGAWIAYATDQAIMLPMLEMSGPAHSKFIPEILYVYHDEVSADTRTEARELGRAFSREIRARKKYERLERL